MKHIFIYWDQGIAVAPLIVHHSLTSWRKINPGWKVHFLDGNSLKKWIPKKELMQIRKFNTLTTQSDLIRLYLVGNYGGLWVDATIVCNIPLDAWLNKMVIQNIWFPWDFDNELPTFNFLFANDIPNIFHTAYYHISRKEKLYTGEYLRIIREFNNITPTELKNKINSTQPCKSSNNRKLGMKAIANSYALMQSPLDDQFILETNKCPFFKLTWKGIPSDPKFKPDSKYVYLYNKILGEKNSNRLSL